MKKFLLPVIGLLALSAGAHAQVLYDGFNYTDATNLVGQVNPGNGQTWTEIAAGTNPATISSGGLTYGDLVTTTGRVSMPAFSSSTQDAGISFTNTTPDIFYSFIFRIDNAVSMSTTFQTFTAVANGATNGLGIAIRQNSVTAGTFDLGIHKRANTGSAETTAALQTLATGTYFVVVNYVTNGGVGDDVMNIWLNPTNASLGGGSAPSATFSSTAGTDTTTQWNQFRLSPPNQIGASFFDEVRVGTTWASVTPVPEPSTWALLAIGMTALVIFRRRRMA